MAILRDEADKTRNKYAQQNDLEFNPAFKDDDAQAGEFFESKKPKQEQEKDLVPTKKEIPRTHLPITIFIGENSQIPVKVFFEEGELYCEFNGTRVAFAAAEVGPGRAALIGRTKTDTETNKLAINNKKVSRLHVYLRYNNGILLVSNMSEKNAIYVSRTKQELTTQERIDWYARKRVNEPETKF